MCYSIESAWFQRMILQCDELLSDFAFKFDSRRYNQVGEEFKWVEQYSATTRFTFIEPCPGYFWYHMVGWCRLTR